MTRSISLILTNLQNNKVEIFALNLTKYVVTEVSCIFDGFVLHYLYRLSISFQAQNIKKFNIFSVFEFQERNKETIVEGKEKSLSLIPCLEIDRTWLCLLYISNKGLLALPNCPYHGRWLAR